jgi:membrane-anchored mycosin MYCP
MDEAFRMRGREHQGGGLGSCSLRLVAVRRVCVLVLVAVAAGAASAASGRAAQPAHPELNPLFASEWWLRGPITLTDSAGQPAASDGVNAIGGWPVSTGEGAAVAVLDSGVDMRTPALAGQLLPGRDFLSAGRPVRDLVGHGTQVATLIAGNPQQADGIFGVAPGARILPLRVATRDGHVVPSAAAAALAFATRHPAVRVVNMSWENDFDPVLSRALADAGTAAATLLVSAAGNDGGDLSGRRALPQTLDSANELTVASTDIFDGLSWFSNYGPQVEVAAPGERILSAYPSGTLKIGDGTSMAAAIVSGVAALLFSRFPDASAADVKEAIVSSCTPAPGLVGRVGCGGIVNAPAALARLAELMERPEAAGVSGPRTLVRAERIRAEVDARYRGTGLAVTEASSTAVIDSFTLIAGAEPRVVPAANGLYYAICPIHATCPYPGRSAREPTAFLPRREGLNLAVRTFLETPADVVAVSLPTRRFVLLILERDDVSGSVDAFALRDALAAAPVTGASPELRAIVDRLTRPHLFAPSALVPVSPTRDTLVASSLFPADSRR